MGIEVVSKKVHSISKPVQVLIGVLFLAGYGGGVITAIILAYTFGPLWGTFATFAGMFCTALFLAKILA